MHTPSPPPPQHVALLQLIQDALRSPAPQQARPLARRLIDLAPNWLPAHLAWARALRSCDENQDALKACLEAEQLNPTDVAVLMEKALVLRKLDRLAEAEGVYRQAIALHPQVAALHHNLGNLLQRRKAWEEAQQAYRLAIQLAPQMAEAHTELGNLLQALGQPAQAQQCWADALDARPNFAPAWQKLETSLNLLDPVQGIHSLQNQARDAATSPRVLVAVARASLILEPDNPLGLYAQGLAARLQGQLQEAITPLARLLSRTAPDHTLYRQGLYTLILCQMDLGQVLSALPAAERLLTLALSDEERAKAHQLLGGLYFDMAEPHRAFEHYRQAITLAPDFLPPKVSYCAAQLYVQASPDHAASLAARLIGPLAVQPVPHSFPHQPDPERPLRVGLLSGDFRQHSCAYFLTPLLSSPTSMRLQWFAYSTERAEDAVTRRLQAMVPNWRRVAQLDDVELDQLIRSDEIDVLIDLAGLTDGHRLGVLARQPAPVQLSWLGYLGSNGLPTMSGRISDHGADPDSPAPGEHGRVWRMPRPYVCYEPPADAPDVTLPPMLSKGYPTFGSFNALTKLSDDCLQLWSRVLKSIPHARLLIKSRPLRDEGMRHALLARLEAHGVSPDRVTLLGWASATESHLATYNEIDVALDSTPFHGVTTTCEASWMGVPVVSLCGHTPASRQSRTLLSALGRADLSVDTADAFVERCQALVADPLTLAARRQGAREQMRASPLMDAADFSAAFEKVCRSAWRAWCEQPGRGQ